jgi:hypothetical protein
MWQRRMRFTWQRRTWVAPESDLETFTSPSFTDTEAAFAGANMKQLAANARATEVILIIVFSFGINFPSTSRTLNTRQPAVSPKNVKITPM